MHRGALYHCAYEFPALRDILEQWMARLAGQARFNSRRLEDAPWAERLLASELFPKPDRASLKACLLAAIDLQLELRSEVEPGTAWKTSAAAIDRISSLISSL